ncbi:MAG: hypothetical protein GY820_12780 [Gammaproteobacteria bacterium]|nr:hypothetical protein [Gammaproteobacteria bacterium]
MEERKLLEGERQQLGAYSLRLKKDIDVGDRTPWVVVYSVGDEEHDRGYMLNTNHILSLTLRLSLQHCKLQKHNREEAGQDEEP